MRLLTIFLFLFTLFQVREGSSAELWQVAVDVPPRFSKGVFASPKELKVYPGLRVSVFASGIEGARFMAESPSGVIFLSVPSDGTVVALPDRDRDGVADDVTVYARGLKRPHGLAFRDGALLVAETGAIVELRDNDGDLRADTKRVLTTDVPSGGGHWTRSIELGPDGAVYLSAGSSCNACVEKDSRRASVLKFTGQNAEPFATGLRNTVGFEFHPKTGQLWGVDNGRDMLGDDLPPEELNLIVAGGDYGWPYCYGRRVPDPELGSAERCRKTKAPSVLMQAHSAPLGVSFGNRLKFPGRLRNSLLIAFHGSWNRTVPTGYKVVAVPFNSKGKPYGKPFDVITGWHTGGQAWGRPVDILAGRDGAMYVSDDAAGAVYRVVYRK